jgi:hypothetical protein
MSADKIKALEALAKTTGRTARDVYRHVQETWSLDLDERVAIEQHLSAAPIEQGPPKSAAVISLVERVQADREAAEQRAAIDIALEHDRLRAMNPFRAADLMNARSSEIFRGRKLLAAAQPNDDEPPTAA